MKNIIKILVEENFTLKNFGKLESSNWLIVNNILSNLEG